MVSGVEAKFVEQGLRERALIQEVLTKTLRPYWEAPSLLKRLTGYPWWVEAVEEAI
jgi:hypothetical protein